MPIEPGTTLLHYTLTEKIGEGGMGAVWRATDTTLNRDVCIVPSCSLLICRASVVRRRGCF